MTLVSLFPLFINQDKKKIPITTVYFLGKIVTKSSTFYLLLCFHSYIMHSLHKNAFTKGDFQYFLDTLASETKKVKTFQLAHFYVQKLSWWTVTNASKSAQLFFVTHQYFLQNICAQNDFFNSVRKLLQFV